MRTRLREAIVQFLWDQWVSIGVAGSIPGAERFMVGSDHAGDRVPFIVDPEALLLATTRFAAHDSRLMGEVLDWLAENTKSINFARIKNLQKTHHIANIKILNDVATFLTETCHQNWDSVKRLLKEVGEEPRPSTVTSRLRGMGAAPDPNNPTCFLFKMRSLFGMSARAEILTWLLTHDCGHPAAIARDTAWFSKTAQSVLNELERSGHVFSVRRGREKVFHILPGQWAFFAPLEGSPSGWFCQPEFYRACAAIDLALQGGYPESSSDQLCSIQIREQLPAINDGLARAGANERDFARLQALRGTEIVEAFAEVVASLIKLRFDKRQLPVHRFKSDKTSPQD